MPLPLISAGLSLLKDGSQNTQRKKQFDTNIFSLLGSAITGRQPQDFGKFQVNGSVDNLANAVGGFVNTKDSVGTDNAQKSLFAKLSAGSGLTPEQFQQLQLLQKNKGQGFAGVQGSQISQANPFSLLA